MGFKEDIINYIRSGETDSCNLGLEIEHFIVDQNGVQIRFDEITSLINRVGKELNAKMIYMDGFPVGYATDTYATSLEPACQFEISINPYSDISKIVEIYEEFRVVWDPIFAERGYHFETFGNLPSVETGKVEPKDIPLSAKKRYKYMDAYFETSGKYGKYMMRASGSTQISVDYRSEKDLVKKLRVLEKISPILMILMENKTSGTSTLPDSPDKPHLLRTQQWDDLDPARTGFVPYSFNSDFGYARMADVILNTPLILLTDNGETIDVGSKSANDLIREGYFDEPSLSEDRRKSLIEHFMSMGFFHFRIKKYIEIRVADAVPINSAIWYLALIKGIVYSDENLDNLDHELKDVETIADIQDAVEAIERDGMDAKIYNGKTASDWVDRLVSLAEKGLSDEDKESLNYVRAVRSVG